jgi:hypothetical protein
MIRTLANASGGTITVPCPVEHHIRILSVVCDIGGPAADGEVLELTAAVGNNISLLFGSAANLVAGTLRAHFAIGLVSLTQLQVLTVVATGVTSYAGGAQTTTAALPNIKADVPLLIALSAPTATVTNIRLAYELLPNRRWF